MSDVSKLFPKIALAVKKIYGLIFFCLFYTVLSASLPGSASITVLRAENHKPLSDAIVSFIPLQEANEKVKGIQGQTNSLGVFTYNFTEPVIIKVSHLGYETIMDTVYVLSDKKYEIQWTTKEVKDVVVTGQYTPNSTQNSVYQVKVLQGDMLKAKGANNLREALQNELNIDLGQDGVFGTGIGINGISGEGVKIMVDGVPIVGRLDGKLDLSQININNIERIEIVEGPLSVMYGTDAMGGVINIITKTYQQDKINILLKGYYESSGQYNAELNTGFSFNKNQIYLSGGRYFFDGYTADHSVQRVQQWKPKEQYFADAKYIYTGNRFRVSVTGAFFREKMLDRGVPEKTLAQDGTSWTYVGGDGHYLTFRPRVATSLMCRFKDGIQLDALLAYTGFFRFSNNYVKDLVTLKEQIVADSKQQDTTRYHQIVFRPTYSMSGWKNRLNFQFGLDINQEFTQTTNLLNRKQQSGDYAAFGSVRITVVKGLAIQAAIRFSYNSRFRVPLIPSLNIRYLYKDKLTLRASYGRGYRAPSLKELYLFFFDGGTHAIHGNAELKPEDGHCINGSFNYTFNLAKKHRLEFATSAFYNRISDKIDFVRTPARISSEPDTFQYYNINRYITYGFQEEITYQWKRLKVSLSGMITHYNMNNSSNASADASLWSPDASVSANYIVPKAEIGINLIYKYTGRKPLFSVNSSIQTGARNDFHWLDASLSRNFWKDRIQLTVGGKNLLNVTNVQANNVSGVGHNVGGNSVNIGWGRTFFCSLILQFTK
ncbi:MAG: TonB-dependent receptor [Bacteroidetes bacterium]|nr:TonB-dependent receptor [Bacteroidota bacterium]